MSGLNIDAYLGLWYEIFRTPFSYEQGCKSATARYDRSDSPGVILVTNTCIIDQGAGLSYSQKGKAFATRKPFEFRIKFEDNKEFSYYVVSSTDYISYSIVTSRDRRLVWVLSRRKDLTKKEKVALLQKVEELGFNPANLIADE